MPLARWAACAALCRTACITDYFDGYLARHWEQVSGPRPLSRPDRRQAAWSPPSCMMLVANGTIVDLTILPALVILCREILVSGLREYLAEIRVPMPVSRLAKWKTLIQMVALGVLVIGQAAPFDLPVREIGEVGLWIAALLTIITGYDYLQRGVQHMLSESPGDPDADRSRHQADG